MKHVPKQKRAKKAHWLTENTVKIAEKRRKAKAVKSDNYKRLCAEFQKAARTDKNNYIQGVCEDIEKKSAKKHAGAMFKKIKEITGSFTHKLGSLKSKDGIILNEAEEVKCRWKEYTTELYLRDQNITETFEAREYEDEPQILESEVRWALKVISDDKSPGSDNIPIELVKNGGEKTVKAITGLCQKIWATKEWPIEWKYSVYVHLPKKEIWQNAATTGQSLSSPSVARFF